MEIVLSFKQGRLGDITAAKTLRWVFKLFFPGVGSWFRPELRHWSCGIPHFSRTRSYLRVFSQQPTSKISIFRNVWHSFGRLTDFGVLYTQVTSLSLQTNVSSRPTTRSSAKKPVAVEDLEERSPTLYAWMPLDMRELSPDIYFLLSVLRNPSPTAQNVNDKSQSPLKLKLVTTSQYFPLKLAAMRVC